MGTTGTTATTTRLWASAAALTVAALAAQGCGKVEVVELAAGGTRSCLRGSDADIQCWGGRRITGGEVPVLHGSNTPKVTPEKDRASGLCVGRAFLCAKVEGARVACLSPEDGAVWTNFGGLDSVLTLGCGESGGCAASTDGSVRCWEWTDAGPGALDTVPDLHDVRAVAVGMGHACAVRSEGTLWCWGQNGAGQLGRPPGEVGASSTPLHVEGLTGVRQVAAGRDFTCALGDDGKVRCFGGNSVGQLGHTGSASSLPLEVAGLQSVQQLVAGEYHACARLTSGEALCWGRNLHGQLGDRTEEDRRAPTAVFELGPVKHLAAGLSHTCAVREDDGVVCWGQNNAGQLGDGTFDDRSHAAEVARPKS